MTSLALAGIDHFHLYVPNREEAAAWYGEHLGFQVVAELNVWADNPAGPLTIADVDDTVHLALFSSDSPARSTSFASTSVAMKCSGESFLAWKVYLEKKALLQRCADHGLSWSLYFSDPWQNMHEITTSEVEVVGERLGRGH